MYIAFFLGIFRGKFLLESMFLNYCKVCLHALWVATPLAPFRSEKNNKASVFCNKIQLNCLMFFTGCIMKNVEGAQCDILW